MKYFIKKHLTILMFSICLSIVLVQIAYGIYENILLENKNEKIIACANTYSYFNIVNPSKENLDTVHDFDNILPLKLENNIEYKSLLVDLFKENLDKIKKFPEKILFLTK